MQSLSALHLDRKIVVTGAALKDQFLSVFISISVQNRVSIKIYFYIEPKIWSLAYCLKTAKTATQPSIYNQIKLY